MLIINKIYNGHPTIPIIDVISETGSIDDGQFDAKLFFFQFGFNDITVRWDLAPRLKMDEGSEHTFR